MDNYLLAIGWWNFVGSLMMLGMLYQPFGQKMLNEWMMMFKDKFILDYWGKLWLFWAAGINVFFGLVNIMAVKWGYSEVKTFLVCADIVAYMIFLGLAVWGFKVGRLLSAGAYATFIIFGLWIGFGLFVLS